MKQRLSKKKDSLNKDLQFVGLAVALYHRRQKKKRLLIMLSSYEEGLEFYRLKNTGELAKIKSKEDSSSYRKQVSTMGSAFLTQRLCIPLLLTVSTSVQKPKAKKVRSSSKTKKGKSIDSLPLISEKEYFQKQLANLDPSGKPYD